MVDVTALTRANAKRWHNATPTRTAQASSVARRLIAAKARYQTVEGKTGVPWFVIGVIHERESSQDWTTHLGQGDPLNKVTVHVPAGRGPFFGPDAWERGAVDALADCAPYLTRKTNWHTPEDVLTNLEAYNGLKYAGGDRPSPYVWSGTSIYDPPSGPGGKVVRDHGPIEDVVDKQLGCAAMLMAMMALDPSISFGKPLQVEAPKPVQPSVTNPSPGSLGAFIASIFNAIFKRK
jgi:lysozyme family protein